MPASEATTTPAPRGRILSRLFKYVLRYRLRVIGGMVLALFVSIANLVSLTAFVPIFNAFGQQGEVRIFNIGGEAALPNSDRVRASITHCKVRANAAVAGKPARDVILLICSFVLPIYLLKMLAITGTVYLIGTAGFLAVRDMRQELYACMNRIGMDYFHKERTGMIMSRMINDVEVVGKSLSVEFNDAVIDVFYIITHLALLAFISPMMLLLALVIVPIVTAPVGRFAKRVRRAAAGQQARLAELGGHIQEVISGIRVIRAFSMENFERDRFRRINESLKDDTFKGHYYHQVGPALTEITATLIVVGFVAWGAWALTNGGAGVGISNTGEFMAFFITLVFLMRPIKQMSVLANLLSAASAAATRVFEFIDMPPGVVDAPDAQPLSGVKQDIVYKNVSFHYPGAERPALQDVSFRVPAGGTIALVGASGAGKSTLMDLLPRFYDVTAGAIEIGGVDLRQLKLRDLRTSIGVVSQDVFLFNATVGENIAYAKPNVSRESLIEATRAANAHEFISDLPQGYDTPIGERGVMLSGGQRQRIAIARALLQNPPILIFDEATSNLDNESERLVQEAIEKLLSGRTVFMIAHRLSTIYRCNEILVLEQGRIVERGDHQSLLEQNGIYKKLYEMQFSS
jgi:ATP-binding cassette, subfamily B, bacterial MsbA